MWFRLASAEWETGKHLGAMNVLANAWSVGYNVSGGITKTSGSGSVSKGGTLTATFTLSTGATFTSATLTPSTAGTVTSTTSGSTVTITIANVSANCTLSVVATGGSVEPEAPVNPPSGGINVLNLNDSNVIWGQSPKSESTTADLETRSDAGTSGYIAVKAGDIIRGGTYRTTTNTDGTNYYPFKSSAIYWYDSSKKFLGATKNPTFNATYYTNDFICTVPSTPANIAYFRVYLNKTYKDTNIVTINSIAPTTFIAYGDTTTPSGYIPQGTAVGGGGGTTSGDTTLEGVISSPSSTMNVFNPADANTTKTLSTVASDGEVYKTQSERGTSGFIAVKSGDKLRQATFRDGSTSSDTGTTCYPAKASPTYFYDKDLKYISRIETYAQDGTNKDWIATVPSNSNIKYMRTMINTKYINSTIITVNNKIDINTFVAYQKAN
jgi:hypothetical protein